MSQSVSEGVGWASSCFAGLDPPYKTILSSNEYRTSRQYPIDHFTVDIGEPTVDAIVVEGEFLVVQTE
jgi:hypothetical protein